MPQVPTDVSAIIPVLAPVGGLKTRFRMIREVREELEHCDLTARGLGSSQTTELALETADEEREWPYFEQVWDRGYTTKMLHYFFQVRAEIFVDPDSVEGGYELGQAERTKFARQFAVADFEKTIGDLITVLNIAKPGSIRTEDIHLFVDRREVKTISGFSAALLGNAHSKAEEFGWPQMHDLGIEEVWAWANRIPGLDGGVPKGPVGRAFSAVTHLLQGPTPLSILWAVMGVEALLTEGHGGIGHQIREKSQIVLGPRTDYKKQFRNVYRFRSKLIHGEVDVPLAYTPYDAAEDYEEFISEIDLNERLAAAMLVGCLQQMIENEAYRLDFTYDVEFKDRRDASEP